MVIQCHCAWSPDVFCLYCICIHNTMCVLQELMVEMVFPCCAICQLDDNDVSLNTTSMSALHSGEDYKGAMGWWLTAGSRAEGLALETGWGHPPADIDTMYLYGGRLGVYVPGGHTPQASASLQYQPEGCRPAYCKLKVINPTALNLALSCYIDISGERHMQVQSCIDKEEGQQWLNTYQTQWLMVDSDETFSSPAGRHGLTVSGPAGKRGLNDFVTTLVCSAPHPDLQRKFSDHSHKQWLPAHVINYILKLPMLLVLVGHKLSIHSKSEARISWSHCEMKIMQELPENVRQGYIACKYVLKRFQGPTEPGDGRSRVSSFHIKTTLLHHLEKRSPHTITSPFRLFIDLLHRLDRYIELGKLPHYFLADCNLLETVGKQELSIARQAIQAILLDPLAALLTSPTDPPQIYGEVCPDALVNSFRRVVTHPMYEQSWNDLFPLLASVDTCRQNRYHRQQKTDGRWVSQRHELSGLCEALKRIK